MKIDLVSSAVLVRRTFRYRIYPSDEQAIRLARWEDAMRFLWNLANEQRLMGLARPHGERKYYSAFDQINELRGLRSDLPWLADVPRNACAQMLIVLADSWRRCFEGSSGRPQWKKKGVDGVVLCEPHSKSWRLEGGSLIFPKLGRIRAIVHRPLEGRSKTCSIVKDIDQWFALIVCEVQVPVVRRRDSVVALDVGCVDLIADSDGNKISNPHWLRSSSGQIARAQRSLSRKKLGSRNREKAKVRFARLHRKVRRRRDHLLHEVSARYAKSHGVVVVERLKIKNMVAEGGWRKAGLNRSIMDSGWRTLVSMLRYKLILEGGILVDVPAAYSSQTCVVCGVVDCESRVSRSLFRCSKCGHSDDADVNAAKVLKSRASHSVLPVEGKLPWSSRRSRKSSTTGISLSSQGAAL